MGDLNRGMGAADPDVRLPPQQLRIELPRYTQTLIVHDSAEHLRVGRPMLMGYSARQPLVGQSLLGRVRQAVMRLVGRS